MTDLELLPDTAEEDLALEYFFSASTPSEALAVIKHIELSHMEYDEDENMDGEWEYEAVEVSDGTVEDNYEEEINLIEKSIKYFDELKKDYSMLKEEYDLLRTEQSKKFDALEIIKKKLIDMYRLKDAVEFEFEKDEDAVEFYNQDYGEDFCITVEEFDLLKEVFL